MESQTIRVVENATCLACGCLCDDLALVVESGRLVEARRACEKGQRHLLADRSARATRPQATIQGQPATREEALRQAEGLLSQASAPLVLGLTFATIEDQALAVALADRLGATLDPARSADTLPRLLALQRVGRVSATLGEVRNRADLVVFWGADPLTTHPRHLERYSVEPSGRFVPEGRADRQVLVIGPEGTPTASVVDQVLPIPEQGYLPALSVLRVLLRQARLDAEQVQSACGVSLTSLQELADRLRSARYGALFLGDGPASSACIEAALLLVRDLNEFTRFVTLNLGSPGNLTGAEAVLGWQAGSGRSTDFSRGIPRFLPQDASAEARLLSGSADAAVIVCDDPSAWLSEEARARLDQIPTLWIDPDATDPGRSVSVGIACAEPGVDAAGTVMRTDGVSLPLRPALPSSRPSASELLRALLDRLDPSGGQES